MSQPVYEASVYTRTLQYKNFKGKDVEVELMFALDPIQLMEIIASTPVSKNKSKNPAKRDELEMTDGQSITFMRDVANKAAGVPSEDGESWEPFEDFGNTLAGKAFLTKLASSDADRKEFAEKVLLDPFRAFVGFAKADPGNSKQEIAGFEKMLDQFQSIFDVEIAGETLEQKRARLEAEMAALTAGDN